MLKLVIEFYIPAFLISAILVTVGSLLYLILVTGRRRKLTLEARREVLFDLIVTDLLVLPVLSFAILAFLVAFKAR